MALCLNNQKKLIYYENKFKLSAPVLSSHLRAIVGSNHPDRSPYFRQGARQLKHHHYDDNAARSCTGPGSDRSDYHDNDGGTDRALCQ